VDSRTWLMAKCSRSSAPARETHAATSSNAVPEIRPALINVGLQILPVMVHPADEAAEPRVYAAVLERARRRC
jgi:hypothetical protein